MSEHVWKIGDWAELYDTRCLVFYVTEDCCWVVKQVPRWGDDQREDTRMPLKNNPELKHLPDCTGWDWQPPKLQLREGAWYERVDGKVVGPCRKSSVHKRLIVGGWMYDDDGTSASDGAMNLIREVPAPAPKIEAPKGYRLLIPGEIILASDVWFCGCWEKLHETSISIGMPWSSENHRPMARKIEPKYRPFANAAEFKPQRDRWVSREGNVGRACGYDEANCYFVGPIGSVYSSVYSGTWSRCFANIVFDDTKKPFGVEVTEIEPTPATPS